MKMFLDKFQMKLGRENRSFYLQKRPIFPAKSRCHHSFCQVDLPDFPITFGRFAPIAKFHIPPFNAPVDCSFTQAALERKLYAAVTYEL